MNDKSLITLPFLSWHRVLSAFPTCKRTARLGRDLGNATGPMARKVLSNDAKPDPPPAQKMRSQ